MGVPWDGLSRGLTMFGCAWWTSTRWLTQLLLHPLYPKRLCPKRNSHKNHLAPWQKWKQPGWAMEVNGGSTMLPHAFAATKNRPARELEC